MSENEVLIITEVDAATGETIERPMTDEEIKDFKKQEALYLEMQIQQEAKSEARASALAKLAELGLTEKEIAAL